MLVSTYSCNPLRNPAWVLTKEDDSFLDTQRIADRTKDGLSGFDFLYQAICSTIAVAAQDQNLERGYKYEEHNGAQ
jgi:hypothetical protein